MSKLLAAALPDRPCELITKRVATALAMIDVRVSDHLHCSKLRGSGANLSPIKPFMPSASTTITTAVQTGAG